MIKKYILFIFLFTLFTFSLCFSTTLFATSISYWDAQRKGTNIFNAEVTPADWQAAASANINIIRLAPDKWRGAQRDFLIGNADNYTGLVAADLAKLKKILDDAHKNNIKVILTMLNLPGHRWRQLNGDRDDNRLWRDEKYQQQAIQFWQDLATALRHHPAIAAYNFLNEPHPEIMLGYEDFTMHDFRKFADKVAGTPADLSRFYQKMVTAVRAVDATTPIILDVGLYADPRAFTYFKPVQGAHILYAFHMYEPYDYTNKPRNNGKYRYPGKMIIGKNKKIIDMNKEKLAAIYFAPVIAWQQQYQVPASRIIAAEFGGHRMTPGLEQYFRDLLSIFQQQKWHWAFYSFREDTWDGMDYELGRKPLGAAYWEAVQRREKPPLTRQSSHPAWQVLQQELVG